jgi:ribosomal subunit interface protein
MQVLVKGKHFDVDGALRTHIEERLQYGVAKYFSEAIEASAVVAHEGHQYRTDCAAHIGPGLRCSLIAMPSMRAPVSTVLPSGSKNNCAG